MGVAVAAPKRFPVLLKELKLSSEMIEEASEVGAFAGGVEDVGCRMKDMVGGFELVKGRRMRMWYSKTLIAGAWRSWLAITTNEAFACCRIGLN